MADAPIFDSTRGALVFALNISGDVKMPAPFMSKAMAEGIRKKRKPKKKSYGAEIDKLLQAEDPLEEERRQYAELVRAAFRPGQLKLTAMERSAQAGFILQEFAKLKPIHQVVLTGILTRSHTPCACRRPCCSGWSENSKWSAAVTATCLMLKDSGEDQREPGKRGFSTVPVLRKAVVEQIFSGKALTMTDLAALAEVSLVTAAKHRAWIVELMDQVIDEAWQEADAHFDAVGIVGSHEGVDA
jgi:hypothetical protein